MKSKLVKQSLSTIHYGWICIFLALDFLSQVTVLFAEDNIQQALGNPITTGQFEWKASQPLVEAFNYKGDHCYSVKDPTIVCQNGRWHLFCTIRSKKKALQIEYRSFVNWANANKVKPHRLDLAGVNCCAPQVFFFEPQKKWYMIYQVKNPLRKPSLQPVFSTTDDLTEPKSWSKPILLFDKQPGNVKMWIDFWVICDHQKAYLFFTSHAGWMWRSETFLDEFPSGWSKPKIVLKGDIFEASHTYYIKGQDKFVTLVEARDGKRRYLKAYTAERLDGKWSPLATTKEKPLASLRNISFDRSKWTNSISHPEFLRSGIDQRLEIDPNNLMILFQGTISETPPDKNYGKIPWKLGLLKLKN